MASGAGGEAAPSVVASRWEPGVYFVDGVQWSLGPDFEVLRKLGQGSFSQAGTEDATGRSDGAAALRRARGDARVRLAPPPLEPLLIRSPGRSGPPPPHRRNSRVQTSRRRSLGPLSLIHI